jgi:hypothetical protein
MRWLYGVMKKTIWLWIIWRVLTVLAKVKKRKGDWFYLLVCE